VELRYLGECMLDEIAKITATPRSTVDRQLRVALEYLREKLRSSFPDFGQSVSAD
jgi:DNA-directed RNA polymerase specialized sigma24 family protein